MGAVRSAFPPGLERRIGDFSVLVHTVGDREYWLVQTGVGLEKARQSAAQVLNGQSFCLMVSTGFACALVAADIGALLIGHEVVQRGESDEQSAEAIAVLGIERDLILAFVDGMVRPEHIGRFVSTDRIIGSASEKMQFAQSAHAIGLDMESSALAAEAHQAQVPFVIIRAVSDLVDEDLPLDFNLFLRPAGWLKGIGAILTAPSCLLDFGRLRRQSMIAAETLTDFFRRYAVAMAAKRQAQKLSTMPL
jgi:adenosylhomocysteine nucleosidase